VKIIEKLDLWFCPYGSNIRWKIFHLWGYYDRKVETADFNKLNLSILAYLSLRSISHILKLHQFE
jgi:hypothetical protein